MVFETDLLNVVGNQMLNKILNALLTAEIALLVIAALFCVATLPFNIQPYGVISGSMEPNIPTGSLVYVDKNADSSDIEKGDVIAFSLGDGNICTHRVVDNEEKGFITKGDANADPDGFIVAYDKYIGKTVFSIPFLGSLLLSISQNRLVWILSIFGVIAATWIACIITSPKKVAKQ